MSESFFEQVRRMVCLIPRGRVATYGQVARLLERPRAARTVGWALHGLSDEQAAVVPWQRVVGAGGRLTTYGQTDWSDLQRQMLRAEGVAFDERGQIDMAHFGWAGPDWGELQAILGPR
jgi:methylated-DNA-protein-cysteine methyltransferase-like protein